MNTIKCKKFIDRTLQVFPFIGLGTGLLLGVFSIGVVGLFLGGLGGLLLGWTIRKCLRELNPQYDR